jgi:serine protease inhibitor
MFPMKHLAGVTFLLSLCISPLFAQVPKEAQPASFLRSNDQFALDLLKTAHQEFPDRNIVLAPLPVSLSFAALMDGTPEPRSAQEIRSTFHWDHTFAQPAAARMLLARFEKPKPRPKPSAPRDEHEKLLLKLLQHGKPEESWLSMAFLYRGKGSLSPEFIERVKYRFGFQFRAVDEKTPQSQILAQNWDPTMPIPTIKDSNDFWITSAVHLRTSWAGNTFIEAKPQTQDFHLRLGQIAHTDFLKSETTYYPYVRADEFEAVVFTCWQATILFVLPPPNADISQVEVALAKNPDMVEPFLAPHEGDVQMPTFHFVYETDMRDSLQKLGVHLIFSDNTTLLSMAPNRSGGKLRGVAQKTEITVDQDGIRADSGTISNGAYGGVMMVREPFHMTLNRPFIFLIRDTVTHALLFIGVVMNPNES